jgi:hypothetical protein
MVASPDRMRHFKGYTLSFYDQHSFFKRVSFSHSVVKSVCRVHLAVQVIHKPPHIPLPVYALVLTSATHSDLMKEVETWSRRPYRL